MILPKSLLDQVEYYECRVLNTYEGFRTIIKLHFKSWWRPTKKLKFDWDFERKDPFTNKSFFIVCKDALELEAQLREYFKERT